jgi:PKD domain-containing protein
VPPPRGNRRHTAPDLARVTDELAVIEYLKLIAAPDYYTPPGSLMHALGFWRNVAEGSHRIWVAAFVVATLALSVIGLPTASSLDASRACTPTLGSVPRCANGFLHESVSPAPPAPRGWLNATPGQTGHPPMQLWSSLAYDPVDGYLVLFGGCTVPVCPVPPQTWTYVNGTWHNITALGPQPPGREYSQMIFDGADGYVLLYGGVGTHVLSDTWSFLGGRWTNLTATVGPPPPPRWGGGFAYDATDGYSLLFGGMSGSGPLLNDSWSFVGGRWTNISGTVGAAPPARLESSMAWDDADGEAILTDGCGVASCPMNDTWSFSGGHWSNRSTTAAPLPPARLLSALSYDAAGGSLRLFGGVNARGSLGDTWGFGGGHWSNLTGTSGNAPRAREGSSTPEDTKTWVHGIPHVLPFDLLYGGDWVACTSCTLTGLSDTWAFESAPLLSERISSSSVTVGQAVTFQSSLAGGTSPYTFSWDFGDGNSSAAPDTEHTYAHPGTFLVTAGGRDAAGVGESNISSITVTVTGAAGTSIPLDWLLLVGALIAAVGAGVAVLFRSKRGRRKSREPGHTTPELPVRPTPPSPLDEGAIEGPGQR